MRFCHFLVCAITATPILGMAQDSMPSTHQHPAAPMIDGATNPGAIPDLVAFRLILGSLSRSVNASDQELAHQSAQLNAIHLADADLAILKRELADFHVQYHNLIDAYNAEATQLNANGQRANLAGLITQRDQLISSYINEIQSRLSPKGWTTFQAWAQAEKTHMKISSTTGVQQ